MSSLLRLLFIFPIILLALVAFSQLIFNDLFNFALWSFAAIITFIIFWPIVIKAEMRYIPIYQIFSILIGVLIIITLAIFLDLRKYLDFEMSLAISIFAGIITVWLFGFISLKLRDT